MLPCCWVLGVAVLTVGDVMAETTVAFEWGVFTAVIGGAPLLIVALAGVRMLALVAEWVHCKGKVDRTTGVWWRRKGTISLSVLVGNSISSTSSTKKSSGVMRWEK